MRKRVSAGSIAAHALSYAKRSENGNSAKDARNAGQGKLSALAVNSVAFSESPRVPDNRIIFARTVDTPTSLLFFLFHSAQGKTVVAVSLCLV